MWTLSSHERNIAGRVRELVRRLSHREACQLLDALSGAIVAMRAELDRDHAALRAAMSGPCGSCGTGVPPVLSHVAEATR